MERIDPKGIWLFCLNVEDWTRFDYELMMGSCELVGNILLLWATSGDILDRKAGEIINIPLPPLPCSLCSNWPKRLGDCFLLKSRLKICVPDAHKWRPVVLVSATLLLAVRRMARIHTQPHAAACLEVSFLSALSFFTLVFRFHMWPCCWMFESV